MYFVPGLACFEDPIRAVERKYGIKSIRIPHWTLSHYLRHGLLMDDNYHAMVAPDVGIVEVEAHVRERFGLGWIAYGHRMDESLHRRGMLHRVEGCWTKFKRVYPLWDWKGREVLDFLAARNIKTGGLSHAHVSTGVGLNPKSLRWMKACHPSDYAKVLKAFPFAEARIAADDMRREKKKGEKDVAKAIRHADKAEKLKLEKKALAAIRAAKRDIKGKS